MRVFVSRLIRETKKRLQGMEAEGSFGESPATWLLRACRVHAPKPYRGVRHVSHYTYSFLEKKSIFFFTIVLIDFSFTFYNLNVVYVVFFFYYKTRTICECV